MRLLILLMFPLTLLNAQHVEDGTNNTKTSEVNAPPFFTTEPLVINVGTYSRALASCDKYTVRDLAHEIRVIIDTVKVEALYVLALKLDEFGFWHESRSWIYTAAMRKDALLKSISENARRQSHTPEHHFAVKIEQLEREVFKVTGDFIVPGLMRNRYDFYVKLIESKLPEIDIIKPMQSTYPELDFEPDLKMTKILEEVRKSRQDFLDYMKRRKDLFIANYDPDDGG